jgi:hypothetical protein
MLRVYTHILFEEQLKFLISMDFLSPLCKYAFLK